MRKKGRRGALRNDTDEETSKAAPSAEIRISTEVAETPGNADIEGLLLR